MLSKKKANVPEKLVSLAQNITKRPVGIVCAHESITMESAKEAYDLNLIIPTFIGNKNKIIKEADILSWNIDNFKIIESNKEEESSIIAANLAKENKIRVIIKGNLHTDILMRTYLKKGFGLIEKKRLSHIWYITSPNNKPIIITDGALNVLPRLDVKMHILFNVVDFAKKTGINKPRVAVLSGTEDPIESMPSSMEAKEIMIRAQKENIEAYIHGPLAFDNAVSLEAAKTKKIKSDVAGKADVLLVPNLETGNSLSKIMVYFMNACAAGFVVGGKIPIVVTSRADNASSRLASIAAAIIAAQ